MSTIEITNQNFQETLEKNEIVLLDFWASWCGPCKMFGPIFEKVATQFPDIKFGKVNTEVEQELSASFQIRSIPTLMAFRQNILLFSQPGVLPEEALKDLISQIKALDMNKVKEEIAEKSESKAVAS